MTQNRSDSEPDRSPPSQGQHLTTISHDGRFWDVYLEFDDDPRRPDSFRALLCFSAADREDEEEPVRTATIIIEDSYEEAVAKARHFQDQQLSALLRSALPE